MLLGYKYNYMNYSLANDLRNHFVDHGFSDREFCKRAVLANVPSFCFFGVQEYR